MLFSNRTHGNRTCWRRRSGVRRRRFVWMEWSGAGRSEGRVWGLGSDAFAGHSDRLNVPISALGNALGDRECGGEVVFHTECLKP